MEDGRWKMRVVEGVRIENCRLGRFPSVTFELRTLHVARCTLHVEKPGKGRTRSLQSGKSLRQGLRSWGWMGDVDKRRPGFWARMFGAGRRGKPARRSRAGQPAGAHEPHSRRSARGK